MIKKITIILFAIFAITLASCNKKPTWASEVDCSECKLSEPLKDFITIDITINDENKFVPIVAYNGIMNNNDIAFLDTARATSYKREIEIGKQYTFCAKYKSGDKIIKAIDGTTLTSNNIEGQCNIVCWIVSDNKLDLRLKF